MDKPKFSQQEELLNKLNEIDQQQRVLKKRKLILQRQKPWYSNPTNIIGIFTILVTIGIFLISFIKNNDRLELTIKYSDPKPLTNFNPNLQNKISVKFDGTPANNIGKITINLTNTGTKALKKEDFSDGPIDFYLQHNSMSFESDTSKEIPFLLDIVYIRKANQKNDVLKIVSQKKNASFTYLPSLINKNETVELEVYLSDVNYVNTKITGNISNGKLLTEKITEIKEVSIFSSLIGDIINLFGTKWLAITVIVVMMLLSLLKSLLSIIENFEKNAVDIFFGTLFIVFDLVFLVLLFGLINYGI
jgi:hypothetical protein